MIAIKCPVVTRPNQSVPSVLARLPTVALLPGLVLNLCALQTRCSPLLVLSQVEVSVAHCRRGRGGA